MRRLKIMPVFGTRPEAIKMVPLILKLKELDTMFEVVIVITAQHRKILDQVLKRFNIMVSYDLDIMRENQTLVDITTRGLLKIDQIIKKEDPDLLLVHGDTTTTFVASLAAYYNQIKVGHIEAGLRTGDKYAPFPEELNRGLTGEIADLHFAPTKKAAENLIREDKKGEIIVTGNTAIDALSYTVKKDYVHPLLNKIGTSRVILLTTHRRENLGEPMIQIFKSINKLLQEFKDIHVVYPVHPNPRIKELVEQHLKDESRVHLIEPLDVVDFHNFMNRAYLILTDSGGIQEEAPALNIPVLVLRDNTERLEGVHSGALKLVGTNAEMIFNSVKDLLVNTERYKEMKESLNPFGDGRASQRIVEFIKFHFNKTEERPQDFS